MPLIVNDRNRNSALDLGLVLHLSSTVAQEGAARTFAVVEAREGLFDLVRDTAGDLVELVEADIVVAAVIALGQEDQVPAFQALGNTHLACLHLHR